VSYCEYKNSILIFIHEIIIISISKTPWLVHQGCTEGSVYKVLRSSATSYVFDAKVCQIDSFVKKPYFSYFQLKVGDQYKSYAPHTACNTCVGGLCYWYDGKRKAMPFAIPMHRREQKNH
jgi:hypothetical protein